ncbi:MAG: hypothetical protein A3K59_04030 [Euryarchaeota archaeon RBG_19FT_COMBO_69_17]|nr:MAG: hypothetical protein A3K59_04030 [Euryarchaeota archaeon RBG_19FT_COMBO_69_17]
MRINGPDETGERRSLVPRGRTEGPLDAAPPPGAAGTGVSERPREAEQVRGLREEPAVRVDLHRERGLEGRADS